MNIINNNAYMYSSKQVGMTKNSLSSKRKYLGEENTVIDEGHFQQERTRKGMSPGDAFATMRNSSGRVSESISKTDEEAAMIEREKKQEKAGLAENLIEKKEASDISSGDSADKKVIECSVVSLSNGLSFYFNDETGEVSCVDDTNTKPGRQSLWSRTLSEEEMARCYKLFDRYKGERNWIYRYEAYLEHESFWDMYLDKDTDIRLADELFKDRKLYDKLLQGSPDTVKKAWYKALEDIGDVFALNTDGNLNYFSELHRTLFFKVMENKETNIFGTTEDSAIEYAQRAIQNLEHMSGYNKELIQMREKEQQFYVQFLNNLDQNKGKVENEV